MKMLILALLSLAFVGCSSSPKILMKNCKAIHDDYYECDEVPQKNLHERSGRN